MRILIASGGTGGHFYPGYALGLALRARSHEVLFLVRKGDPAAPRLAAEDLPYTEIDLHGFSRTPSFSWLTLPFKLLASLRICHYILRSFGPAAVAGMGSYISLPAVWAARRRGVPFVLHESNAVLGLANRWSLRGAETLALGLPLARDPGVPTTLTGTPIRAALHSAGDPAAARRKLGLVADRKTVLVFGGSQGARALNDSIPAALGRLSKNGGAVQALHLCGKNNAADVRQNYASAGVSAVVSDYCDAMEDAYAAANVVVSRSGASTVAEINAQKIPALLVPYPHATGAHQEANARVLEKAGAARVLLERNLSAESTSEAIAALLAAKSGDSSAAFAALSLPPADQSADALAGVVESAGKRYLTRQ